MTVDRTCHRYRNTMLNAEDFNLSHIDNNWTLFLDRDGVMNHEIQGTYVRNWEEFIFYPQTPENIKYFNSRFRRLFLATNQRGITRGHHDPERPGTYSSEMLKSIDEQGGKIDRIYFCVDADSSSPCRKPNPGMALQAAKDFPEIDLNKSIMVGNNISDMLFGKNAGMKTVFLKTTNPEMILPHPMFDLDFNNLNEFAAALKKS